MRTRVAAPCVLVVAVLAASGCRGSEKTTAPVDAAAADAANAELAFVRDGKRVATLDRAALEAAVPAETWTAFDPYYNRPKTYRALPVGPTLAFAFRSSVAELEKLDFVLRARDGYTLPMSGASLFEKGGYIAVADVDVPGWEPVGPQRANPGPYYLVWRDVSQASLDTHPRPWQLASIEIAPFDATFPHTVPMGLPTSSPASRGFGLFRAACIKCHAMNREGGRVGPDLNVPRSIVEYRPRDQIRAYIKDPRTFRYSTMPAHPNLSEEDLDALLAYFDAMKDRKYDPDADAAAPAH